MKVIIAGSRGITDIDELHRAIRDSGWQDQIVEVLTGGAHGVDYLGECWGRRRDLMVCTVLPNWKAFGKAAGPRRNISMASMADALIAVWDGKSRGTAHIIQTMREMCKPVYVHLVEMNKPRTANAG